VQRSHACCAAIFGDARLARFFVLHHRQLLTPAYFRRHNKFGMSRSVAFGGDAVTNTNIYNQTVEAIQKSSVNDEQKKQATGILDYVKRYAPTFLPLIADAAKKALGL
jgi:hypothetical protein